jgi:Zn-dependent protease with chaperone function
MIAGPETHGYFLDGQNPVQYAARIGLLDTAVRFQVADSKKSTLWDFTAIDWDATRSLNGQLRLKHDESDAWLIVTDAAMIAAILGEKKVWAQRHFWLARRETLTIVRATATTMMVCTMLWIFWPWLATPLANFVPNSSRTWMADTAQSILGMKQECRAPEGLAALRKITNVLTAGNPKLNHAQIVVVNASMLNALTLANDKILVTKAIIAGADSPDEVAGILAHELGHVAHRHILRSLLGQVTLKLLVMIFTGAHGDMLGYANDLTSLNHSRQFEAEADTTAIEILTRAHITTHGLGEFFHRMQHYQAMHNGEPPRYLSTHPPSEERAQQMLHIDIPDARPVLSASEWQALQNICGVAANDAQEEYNTPNNEIVPPTGHTPRSIKPPPRPNYDSESREL